MNTQRFNEFLHKFEFTQQEAAAFFGESRRTIVYWCAKNDIPDAVAMTLELMDKHGVSPVAAREISNLAPADSCMIDPESLSMIEDAII